MRWSDEFNWVCGWPGCHKEARRNYMFMKHWKVHQKPPVKMFLQCTCSKALESLVYEPPQVESEKSNCIKKTLALCECPTGKTKFVYWGKMHTAPEKIVMLPIPKMEPKSP